MILFMVLAIVLLLREFHRGNKVVDKEDGGVGVLIGAAILALGKAFIITILATWATIGTYAITDDYRLKIITTPLEIVQGEDYLVRENNTEYYTFAILNTKGQVQKSKVLVNVDHVKYDDKGPPRLEQHVGVIPKNWWSVTLGIVDRTAEEIDYIFVVPHDAIELETGK